MEPPTLRVSKPSSMSTVEPMLRTWRISTRCDQLEERRLPARSVLPQRIRQRPLCKHVYSLLGDAYMEQDTFSEAADAYHKASNYKPNKYFTPLTALKEASAYEKLVENRKSDRGLRSNHQRVLGFARSSNGEKQRSLESALVKRDQHH